MHAALVQSVAERLRTAADKLGLTDERRSKIRARPTPPSPWTNTVPSRRLSRWPPCSIEELKAISGEQAYLRPARPSRKTSVRIGLWSSASEIDPNDPNAVARLRETIAEIGYELDSPIGWV